jgi:hypothetical protein
LQVSPVGQGDDKARFLAEFRALRDGAALDYDELAVRAHFPTDVLRDAEAGPGLPGLPILAAYVRACGGDILEWEERWRMLDRVPDEDGGLPVRAAGASPAAVAGARAGVGVSPAEAHDAERIRAALRSHHEREEQRGPARRESGRRGPGSSGPDHGPAGGGPAGSTTMLVNGGHHKKHVASTVGGGPASASGNGAGQVSKAEFATPQARGLLSSSAAAAAAQPDSTEAAQRADEDAQAPDASTPTSASPRDVLGNAEPGSAEPGIAGQSSLAVQIAKATGFNSRQAVTLGALVCVVIAVCIVLLIVT